MNAWRELESIRVLLSAGRRSKNGAWPGVAGAP
jgi:hypothetical protein